MHKIRKSFKFEMAHVLSNSYSKECRKIHGHSYKMEVIISCLSLNKDGMVIDFKRLKEIVVDTIISKMDHAFVAEKGRTSIPHVAVPYNPTAENMVIDFFHRLRTPIKKEIPSFYRLTVRLHETETGYAEYSGGK